MNTDRVILKDKFQYYQFFLGGKVPKPTRDPKDYDIGHRFFSMIAESSSALEQILEEANYPKNEAETLPDGVDIRVISTAHGQVSHKTMSDLLEAKGIQARSEKYVRWLTGHSGTMISDEPKRKYHGSIVICSDLPRSIDSALRKYAPETENELIKYRERTLGDITDNKGVIRKDTQDGLVWLAIYNDIIPTLLARAGFYGSMELLPERSCDFDLNSIMESGYHKKLLGMSDPELNQAWEWSKERSDAAFHAKDDEGMPVSESRLMIYLRIKAMMDLFLPTGKLYEKLHGRTIDIVSHSSITDAISAYFRHFNNKTEINITREPKEFTRGAEIAYLISAQDRNDPSFFYLNDPRHLDPLRQNAIHAIERIRERSIDPLIKSAKSGIKGYDSGIIDTPIQLYESYDQWDMLCRRDTSLDDLLALERPIMIFGHGGQGKSIYASIIAERFLNFSLNSMEFNKLYANVVPILIDCDTDINSAGYEQLALHEKDPVRYALNANGLHKIPKHALEEHRIAVIFDDVQKLSQDYRDIFFRSCREHNEKGCIMIALSRQEKTDAQPPYVDGFSTAQIDTGRVSRSISEFARGRIDPSRMEEFIEYCSGYDESITGFYLTKLFLTMIFPGSCNPQNPAVIEYIIDDRIKKKIKDGEPLKRYELYEASTNYLLGQDARRQDPGLPMAKIREKIFEFDLQHQELARSISIRTYMLRENNEMPKNNENIMYYEPFN